jgi:hypothetical protein
MTSCATFPTHRIAGAAKLGTAAVEAPFWWRRLLVFFAFPRILRYVNRSLSNELMASLKLDDVKAICGPIHELHHCASELLEHYHHAGWWKRLLYAEWRRSMAREIEQLGDIAEAFAWGADDDLRVLAIDAAAKAQRAAEEDRVHLPA